MKFFVIILSIYFFIETFKYALFEFKEQNNKTTGVLLMVLSVVCSVGSSIITFIRY